MRVAIISDVHANLEALKAVAKDIEKSSIEKVIFLGDAVGYGADPNACVKMINSLCDIKLLGNHDYVSLGLEQPRYFNQMAQESIIWTQNKLSKKSIETISDFDMESSFLDYFLVHATPENPAEWNYLLSIEEAEANFDSFAQNFCFVGHSHIPVVFCRKPSGEIILIDEDDHQAVPGCRYIINVGSVGQPRDGNPDACYVILDTEQRQFGYRRVAYDLAGTQKKMTKANLPEFLISRLASGE